jgi:hypothetical protein
VADANGLYTLKLNPYSNGTNYEVYATATDAAGNVSVASDIVGFKVDATAPATPAYSMSYSVGSNQATFTGTGEANSTIELVRSGDLQTIARTTVGDDGKWELQTSPLPNGNYTVSVISIDKADNGASAASRATLTVSSAANITGTAANDTLKPGAGNNAVDGGDGLDTAVYTGSRSNFTLAQEAWGYGVTDKVGTNGHDSLINVERVHFEGDDAWVALDIDGTAGQLFRLYSAAFGRPSDVVGMGFWIWRMETGSSLNTVAREFMTGQPEFDAKYGVNPTDATFVTNLYNNVLHRDPDSEGFQYWLNALAGNSNKVEVRAQVLIEFADSLENQVNVADDFKVGIDFKPWLHT